MAGLKKVRLVINSLDTPFSSCQVQFSPGLIPQRNLRTIHKHLDNNQVIKNSQHEFVKNKLCQTNLISFFDRVTGLVDSRELEDVMYLDLSEAFDTVQHDILISKLEKYGLDEIAISGCKAVEKCCQREVIGGALPSCSRGSSPGFAERVLPQKVLLSSPSNPSFRMLMRKCTFFFFIESDRGRRGGLQHFGVMNWFRSIYIKIDQVNFW